MKSPRLFYILSILLLLTSATAFAFEIRTVGSAGTYPTVQEAINASAASGDALSLLAGNTFAENIIIDRSITITGVDTTAKINGSITINFTTVTLQNFVVYGSSGNGISATGISTLTFNSVVSRNNAGSGLDLINCTTVTINGGSYSGNLAEGINAKGGSTYTMTGVRADSNGTGTNGSGINAKGMSTVTLTDLSANGNHHHGLSVGDGATGVTIVGGNFTGNGTAGDATTGGGISFIASGGTTTSAITLDGIVNSSNNTTAGIYIFSESPALSINAINTVGIGATGPITLSNNGSSNNSYSGGAGVLIYGIVSAVHIANTTFTKGAAPGDGIMNLGEGTQATSPIGTEVAGSTFVGYTSVRPAVTLTDSTGAHPSPSATNDVTATNNTFIFPVAAKVFLQGPFSGSAMGTALATNHLIPVSQPYTVAPFSYAGTESPADTNVFVNQNVTDWVLVELRSTFNGAAVSRHAALLKNDGTLLDTNGTPGVLCSQTLASGYTIRDYVVIKHRNHLAVMSKDSLTLPNDTSAYNLTTAQSQAFGTSPMFDLSGGAFGLYSGDADQDGQITGTDFNLFNPDAKAVVTGYVLTDFNMDSQVTGTDFNQFNPNAKSVAVSQIP